MPASSNTDQYCPPTFSCAVLAVAGIAGINFALLQSATKTVKLTRLAIRGVATAGAQLVATLVRYSTPFATAGTFTNPAVVQHDPRGPANTALLNYYTAVPTGGTIVGSLRAEDLTVPAAGAAPTPVIWTFPGTVEQCPLMPAYGVTTPQILVAPVNAPQQALVLNLSAGLGAGGAALVEWSWNEEQSV